MLAKSFTKMNKLSPAWIAFNETNASITTVNIHIRSLVFLAFNKGRVTETYQILFANMKPEELNVETIIKAYEKAKINETYIVNLRGDNQSFTKMNKLSPAWIAFTKPTRV